MFEQLAELETDPRLLMVIKEKLKQCVLTDVRTHQELFLMFQNVLREVITGNETSIDMIKFGISGLTSNFGVDPVAAYTTLNTLLDEKGDLLLDEECLSALAPERVWWMKTIDPTLKLRDAFLEKVKKLRGAFEEKKEAAHQAERERNAAWERESDAALMEMLHGRKKTTSESDDNSAGAQGTTTVPTDETSLPVETARKATRSSPEKAMPGQAEKDSSLAWLLPPIAAVGLLTLVALYVLTLKRR